MFFPSEVLPWFTMANTWAYLNFDSNSGSGGTFRRSFRSRLSKKARICCTNRKSQDLTFSYRSLHVYLGPSVLPPIGLNPARDLENTIKTVFLKVNQKVLSWRVDHGPVLYIKTVAVSIGRDVGVDRGVEVQYVRRVSAEIESVS